MSGKINKIIHQIWIGDREPPYIYIDSWRYGYINMYPEWKYILWTNDSIYKLNLKNYEIFEKEETYYGKSDILRLEILNQYGGVYIDADSFWLNNKNLDDILEKSKKTNFFAAKQPKKDFITNGVIGSSKNHINLMYLIDYLYSIKDEYEQLRQSTEVHVLTGPMLLNKLVENNFTLTIIPSKLFYPIKWSRIYDPLYHINTGFVCDCAYMFQYGTSSNRVFLSGYQHLKKVNESCISEYIKYLAKFGIVYNGTLDIMDINYRIFIVIDLYKKVMIGCFDIYINSDDGTIIIENEYYSEDIRTIKQSYINAILKLFNNPKCKHLLKYY
jgi:inositol phosphorylceramide mannosyltransferase catalytic subunit